MKFAAHQPNFMPYLGFFDKIQKSDVFVILDDAQFQTRVFLNRNKIMTSQGVRWLTLPVEGSRSLKINEVLISQQKDWKTSHLKTLERNYKKAQNFDSVFEKINKIYSNNWERMIDINMLLINYMMDALRIFRKKIIFSSEMGIEEKGSDRLVKIAKKIGADTYLSGLGAKTYKGVGYIDEELFRKNNIEITYQNFQHPIYHQCWGNEFIPNLSAIDFLFNS